MPIERIVIDNFKSFRHLNLQLNAHMNLVVGDNEVGKSTWTGQSSVDTQLPLCA
jgi:predicted ATP-dependent endonuclease of OLD family